MGMPQTGWRRWCPVELIQPPRVVQRPELDYLGIRLVMPFRGMSSVRDQLMSELAAWLKANGVDGAGPLFLRLHVIDMSGPMDIEVGFLTPGRRIDGDDRVRAAVLPAGDYATLTYRDHAIAPAVLCWSGFARTVSPWTVPTIQRETGSRAGTRPISPIRGPRRANPNGISSSTCALPDHKRSSTRPYCRAPDLAQTVRS
jgi:hypothetical protein